MAIPSACIILVPSALVFLWLDESLDYFSLLLWIFVMPLLAVILYFFLMRSLKRQEPDEWKHFDLHHEEAIKRIEELLKHKGIQYTKAPLDDRWFDTKKKRLGIDRDVLDFKDVHSTVYELADGASRIMVSDIQSDGKKKTAVSLWPMRGDHIQFFEGLKADIDAELATGPL